MSLTVLIALGGAMFLKWVKDNLPEIRDSIDKSIEEDAQSYKKISKEIFRTLHQAKHPLGKDGFEVLT